MEVILYFPVSYTALPYKKASFRLIELRVQTLHRQIGQLAPARPGRLSLVNNLPGVASHSLLDALEESQYDLS
jgi:hypothetical protein